MTDKRVAQALEKKKQYIMPCVYHFYKNPMVLKRGEMQYLYDHNDKQYLDMYSGVSVINAGHANPFITERVAEQLKTLGHTTTIYLNEPILDLAEKLAEVTPEGLNKIFFVNSGTEANEGALLLASLYQGNSEFIALTRGLHGRSKLTMSITGLSFWRTDPQPVGGISFIQSPYCYRCHMKHPECDLACTGELERVIKTDTSGKPAAFIAEPIQGNGGIITPPKDYFVRIKEIIDRYKALLIFDEVQTGFGRTGRFFASEHFNVVPDIMTVAKALGNGLPIGAFISTDEISAVYTRPGASTTGGNPVSAAAGLAVIEYLKTNDLPAKSGRLGDYFKERLLRLKEKFPVIGDVRGLGLMLGAELVKPDKTASPEATDMIIEQMKDRGFLIGKTGMDRNVLTFMPPLVIEQGDVDRSCDNLEAVLRNITH
jgi:4-aminobutyrate aminotransferase/4-aminobutyrate aminotransferase/(S)-3-amino-2-methylpropionate transaminase